MHGKPAASRQTLAASLAEGTWVMLDGARVSMVLIGRQLASASPNSVSGAEKLLRVYLVLHRISPPWGYLRRVGAPGPQACTTLPQGREREKERQQAPQAL
ncbi:MAG: hypothetical protein ACYCY0_12405 [Acidithiobacillus ferrivorans]